MAPNSKIDLNVEKLETVEDGFVDTGSETTDQEWLFDDALQLIGFGTTQYGLILVCGVLQLAALAETLGMMMLQTPSQCDLELSSTDKGLLTSAGYLGLLIPAYMWGYISDEYGRRNVILYTLLATNVCAVCSSFAPSFIWFFIFRLGAGFFISGVAGGIYPYLGEFITLKHRPTVMSWATVGGGVGVVACPLAAWYILSFDFEIPLFNALIFRPWRLIPIVFTLPGLISALIFFKLPESPRFYMAHGHEEKALQVLRWIFTKNTGLSADLYPVKRLVREKEAIIRHQISAKTGLFKLMWIQMSQLLKPPHVKSFFILSYIQVAILTISGGLALWMPEILNKLSKSDGTTTLCGIYSNQPKILSNGTLAKNFINELCEDQVSTEAFVNATLNGVYGLLGYILVSMLMKPLGRTIILGCCTLGSAFCGFMLLWVKHKFFEVILFSAFLTLSGLMIGVSIGAAVMLFPTHLRVTAVSINLMMGRTGAAVGSAVVGLTIETHCESTMGIMAGMVLLASILNLLLPRR